MEGEDLRRRLKAARSLTPPTDDEVRTRSTRKKEPDSLGITVDELAERIGEAGLGAKTIGNIERGTRNVRRYELAAIAQAMGLPLAFFVMDRSELLALLEADQDRILDSWRASSGSQPGEDEPRSETGDSP